jgi:hypothetical protein
MRFIAAQDGEANSLCQELAARATDTDAPGLMTANLWLWAFEANGLASDPRAVVAALLGDTGMPCRELIEPHAPASPWVSLAPAVGHAAIVRLLTSGASLEIAAFHDERHAAALFASRLFGWVGRPLAAFASMEHRPDGSAAGFGVFRLPHWVDEGLALVGPERVGLVWFVGTD